VVETADPDVAGALTDYALPAAIFSEEFMTLKPMFDQPRAIRC
jgi:hypothetical protein